jgi:cellulose synthase/poly-beta-1,6-N-acetylglucosamine synthase-like glycosyltransferase
MYGIVNGILIAAGAVLAVPVLTLLVEIVAAWRRRSASTVVSGGPRPRVAVVIPAHNEEATLSYNLRGILNQLGADDRLVVVADNCSDATANVAREQGAEVTVRSNLAERGKGYALDHGLNFLEQTGAPDIVICIDADCELEPNCIERLAQACLDTGAPTQAAYMMRLPLPAGRFASITVFAWLVKNYVRPLGLARMGLPCQLTGTGMAFHWSDIRSANLKSANLVEDLTLGLDLALTGKFPEFCPEAVVISEVAAQGTPSFVQRARWEHGAIATAIRYVPSLFGNFRRSGNGRLLAMMLDLAVPPLALLLLLLTVQVVLATTLYAFGGSIVPLTLGLANCALLMTAVGLAWCRHGRDVVSLRTLALAPMYALRKVPLYLRLFANRQTEWVKGNRGFSA